MATTNLGHPVLILGGGRGGTALLEMFLEDNLVEVLGIADPSPAAPGITLAKKSGIPTFSVVSEALKACRDHSDLIVYNLTHDESVAEEVSRIFVDKKVTGGVEAKLFWQIVTNLKQIKGELEQSQGQLNAIIHHAMDGIITVNESGEIQAFNPAAETIFGYSQTEMIGQHVKALLPPATRDEYEIHINQYLKSGERRTAGVRGREVVALRKHGEHFPMEVSASEMLINEHRFFVGIVRDITERKLVEEKIKHMAHHDYLTGLPNRAMFMEHLEYAIRMAKRAKYKLGVLFLDLDGFKHVNDSLGHEAGDLLLQQVAARLKTIVRDSDTAARLGGDEFTFILNDIGSDDNACAVAQKIIDILSDPFDLNGAEAHLGGSVGVSMYSDDADDSDILLRQADEAMYVAKQQGKNTYRFYRNILPNIVKHHA
jgi:diguanylate cyclase (GGDEF)-like protein/PAS domain S-box-containing protein